MNWRTPKASGDSGSCVEVAKDEQGRVHVRNSNDPEGAVVVYTETEWRLFTAAAKDEFDYELLS